ncbi:MAG: hypothetical protein KY461_01625 [Actinobacteria bacterium]|nr:hypothetical protein [Actinomycetota bacterium]
MSPVVALAAALVVAASAGGCGGGSEERVASGRPATATETVTTPVSVDHTLVVDVQRSRSAAGRDVLEVRLRTTGDEPVEVTGLQLLDERFTPVPPAPKSTSVRPGRSWIITPIPATDAVCDAATDVVPRMAVSFLSGGDTVHVVVAVAPEGSELLAGIHADECRRRRLTAAVELRFGDDWTTVSPATARGTIELERRTATGAVVLAQVQGTVIFSLRLLEGAADGPVLTLPAGDDATEVPVEISAARCDPHALIESKKTYLFPMWVELEGEPVVFLTVEPTGPARTAFEALLREGCHLED